MTFFTCLFFKASFFKQLVGHHGSLSLSGRPVGVTIFYTGEIGLRIVFMGTPEFAIPPLEHLLFNSFEVVAVYTQPDRPAGRGRAWAFSPVKETALAWKLPLVQPPSLRRPEVLEQLKQFHPDVIVVAAFGQILPQAVLDVPSYGCINTHFSLLPRFRGASPVAAAVLAGDEFTGVSLMLMEAGLDIGPVLSRAQIPISEQDTTGSLTAKLALIAAHFIQDILLRWSRKEIAPQPQDEAGATFAPLITKKDGEIDWRLPAVDIWRRVRAFYPWPGAYTTWQGKQLKIVEAVPLPGEMTAEVGKVVALTSPGPESAFGIATGQGILGVRQVQLEGKRAMPAAEFLRGQRQFLGVTLPSG